MTPSTNMSLTEWFSELESRQRELLHCHPNPESWDVKSKDYYLEDVPKLVSLVRKYGGALAFVANREHLMFAECTDAENIVEHTREALLYNPNKTTGQIPLSETDTQRCIVENLQRQRDELVELITKERQALVEFLIPWRDSLDQTWLDHFSQNSGVYFDSVGFVKTRPIVLQCNNQNP